MTARKNLRAVPTGILLLGLGAMGLRFALNYFFLDPQNGLVPSMHPLTVTAGVLLAAALVLGVWGSKAIDQVEGYEANFPPSVELLLGHTLAAAGILATVLTSQVNVGGSLALVWKLLAFASVPCLVAAGVLGLRGQKPQFLCHLVPALFLLFHAVSNYQTWSSEPQIVNYVCQLLGLVFLMLFAFYHSAFDAGLEWRQRLTFSAYAAACLSLAAIPGSSYPWLYLGCGLWALLDRPVPQIRRPHPFVEETT